MAKERLSKVVDYHCEKCRHVKFHTRKKLAWLVVKRNIASIITIMGLLFIAMLIIVGPSYVFNTFSSGVLTSMSRLDSDELRRDVINMTSVCNDNNLDTSTYCYAYTIYKNLSVSYRYVPDSYYSIMGSLEDTYAYGGDCKHVSRLFVAMMHSVGMQAEVSCNKDYNHCVAVVPNYVGSRNHHGYLVVDLTRPGLFFMNDTQDPWSYMLDGVPLDNYWLYEQEKNVYDWS